VASPSLKKAYQRNNINNIAWLKQSASMAMAAGDWRFSAKMGMAAGSQRNQWAASASAGVSVAARHNAQRASGCALA
jgi:hypothetical protein